MITLTSSENNARLDRICADAHEIAILCTSPASAAHATNEYQIAFKAAQMALNKAFNDAAGGYDQVSIISDYVQS
jgi:hypothetical protein